MSNATTSQKLPSANALIVFIVFKSLSLIVGIFGNACVIIYNVWLKHSKTPTSYFVVNLAINDFFACCLIYPIWMTTFTRSALQITRDTTLFCLVDQICSIGVILSILTLFAITVDKFVFINWPLKYHLIVTWRRTYFSLLMIWVFGLILIPFSLLFETESRVHRFCGSNTLLYVFAFILYILIPFFIIFILNYKIFKIAQQQRLKIAVNFVSSDITQSRNPSSINSVFSRWRITRELKNIKTFGIIIGVLLCCILPFTTLRFVELLWCNESCVPFEVGLSFAVLVGLNSIVNPFIYGIRQMEYRNAFRRLWSKMVRRDHNY